MFKLLFISEYDLSIKSLTLLINPILIISSKVVSGDSAYIINILIIFKLLLNSFCFNLSKIKLIIPFFLYIEIKFSSLSNIKLNIDNIPSAISIFFNKVLN